MEARRAALRVGMFTIGGVIVLLALVFFLSGAALHPGAPYETYFSESVQGLDIGTSVKFRGVTIGKITDVGLVAAEYAPANPADLKGKVYQQVVVRFRIDLKKIGPDANIGDAVTQGLRVQIAPQGITGLAYLELSFVPPANYPIERVPWTAEDPIIPSVPSTLAQLQDAAEQVMSSLTKLNLAKLVGHISDLAQALDSEVTTGTAHQAIANANTLLLTLNAQVKQADLGATTASLRDLAGGPQTKQILTQLSQTTQQLSKVSAELPALVTASQVTIAQASETTADLQSQLIPILQNMKAATGSLRDLTSSLGRNPSQVLLGAAPPPEDDK